MDIEMVKQSGQDVNMLYNSPLALGRGRIRLFGPGNGQYDPAGNHSVAYRNWSGYQRNTK